MASAHLPNPPTIAHFQPSMAKDPTIHTEKVNWLKLEPTKAPGGRSTLKMIRKTSSIDLEGFL